MSEKSPKKESSGKQGQWESEIALDLVLLPIFIIGDFVESLFNL